MLAGQIQVQQGERTALTIERGAACLDKTIMQVEPDRFRILLIHVNANLTARALLYGVHFSATV